MAYEFPENWLNSVRLLRPMRHRSNTIINTYAGLLSHASWFSSPKRSGQRRQLRTRHTFVSIQNQMQMRLVIRIPNPFNDRVIRASINSEKQQSINRAIMQKNGRQEGNEYVRAIIRTSSAAVHQRPFGVRALACVPAIQRALLSAFDRCEHLKSAGILLLVGIFFLISGSNILAAAMLHVWHILKSTIYKHLRSLNECRTAQYIRFARAPRETSTNLIWVQWKNANKKMTPLTIIIIIAFYGVR